MGEQGVRPKRQLAPLNPWARFRIETGKIAAHAKSAESCNFNNDVQSQKLI
jgi:hypothetical protein